MTRNSAAQTGIGLDKLFEIDRWGRSVEVLPLLLPVVDAQTGGFLPSVARQVHVTHEILAPGAGVHTVRVQVAPAKGRAFILHAVSALVVDPAAATPQMPTMATPRSVEGVIQVRSALVIPAAHFDVTVQEDLAAAPLAGAAEPADEGQSLVLARWSGNGPAYVSGLNLLVEGKALEDDAKRGAVSVTWTRTFGAGEDDRVLLALLVSDVPQDVGP